MVAQPNLNYSSYFSGTSPIQKAMEMYETTKVANAQEKAAQAEAEKLEAETAGITAMQEATAELMAKEKAGTATSDDYVAIIAGHPEYAEHYKEVLAGKGTEETQAMQSKAWALASLVDAGQPEKAKAMLNDFITAAEEEGQTDEVKQFEMMKEVLNTSDAVSKGSNLLFLSGTMDPDEFTANYEQMQNTERKAEMQDLEMKKTLSDIGLADAQTAEIMAKVNNRGIDLSELTSEQKNLLGYQELIKEGKIEEANMLARAAEMFNEGTITNEDDFVTEMTDAWLSNPDNAGKTEVPGGLKAEWRLKYKRAQEGEVYANELASQQAKFEFSEKISHAAKYGERMAMIATAAATRKAEGELSEVETMQNAKYAMEDLLGQVASKYFKLNEMNAIINVEDTSMENVWQAARSSDVGQWFGERLGTEPQALREFINASQSAMLNEIKQAKNISARGLDSEKELEFYRKILSDPKRNIQTNLALLALMSESYGDGSVATELRANPDKGLVQLIDDLKAEHDQMYADTADSVDNTRTPAVTPTVTTQAEIDRLPTGAYFYIVQDGKTIKARKD